MPCYLFTEESCESNFLDDQDPWETLRQEVEESLSSTYDKKVNKFLKEGVSEMIAEVLTMWLSR